tara:strand:- start:198 stop:848 length:651 start_codon:yes stop_codon:yes gene_type:complete
MDQATLNNNMIDGQIRPINGINKEVISAFLSVNRSDFVPEDLILRSYTEKNLKLSSDRYLLRPNLIGEIINHVSPKSNESVLVLPASTGYSSAIISNLAETVIAVEEEDNFISIAEKGMSKSGINNVVVIKKKINENCLDQGPFNAIIIEGAIDYLPDQFLNQLENDGRLFALIKKEDVTNAMLYIKNENSINSRFLFSCDAPKLNFFKKKNSFSF